MKIEKFSDTQAVPSIIEQRLIELKQLRKSLIKLSPEKAMDLILSCDRPLPLVHSIPEQDLLMLVQEIGEHDALPILEMASSKQWQYMIDIKVWKRDRLCMIETTKWLYLMMKAEPDRFIKWFLNDDPKFFYFYLYQNIDIIALQEDEDFSDLPNSFFTLDDVYYISISDYRLEEPLDRESNELREELIVEFLKRLAEYDHKEYQKVLTNISSVMPAEFEEESFRLKNIQLESHGFLPFDEAIGIYHPISDSQFFNSKTNTIVTSSSQVNTPQYPIQILKQDNYFYDALVLIESEETLSEIHLQFANLCNQIISADAISVSSQEILKNIVSKACGYIHIAIESLLDSDDPSSNNLREIVLNYPVKNLFQWGYSRVLKVKWKADSWYKNSFIKELGLSIDFWGEKCLGVLGGLMLKRPRYFSDFEHGELYREFQTMSEILKTEETLSQIMALDEIFSIFSVRIHPVQGYQLTFHNVLLTLFARHILSMTNALDPIPLSAFKPFYESLWPPDTNPPYDYIQLSIKESFMGWFSDQTRFDKQYIYSRFGIILEQLFDEILSELGNVSFHSLDPQFVSLFLLI